MKETALEFAPETARAAALRQLTVTFAACGVEDSVFDARLLVCAAAEIAAADLMRDPHLALGDTAAHRLADYATRRMQREPVSRILGSRGFWDVELLVTPAVLDPRPETEILVEAACEILAARRTANLRILDLGTGSAALLCALLREFPMARGVGIELSAAACDVARRNLARYGLTSRCEIVEGDWAAATGGRFDLIVANPPYIATETIGSLAPEVRDHDPLLALDGGPDGLNSYRAIADLLPRLLTAEGVAILEIGAGQGAAVHALIESAGLTAAPPRHDLAGRARAVVAFAPLHSGRSA